MTSRSRASDISVPVGEAGFTLMELLMVILILGVLSAMSITSMMGSVEDTRFTDTVARLKSIRDAMLGDTTLNEQGSRTSFGYVGDVGSIPTSAQTLYALVANPSLPAWSVNTTARFGIGWNGPYLTSSSAGTNFTVDAWNRPFVYEPTASPPRILSYGADGVAGGTGFNQDIIVELPVALQRSNVSGFITSSGAPYSGTATIDLYHPNGSGALATTSLTIASTANGYFSFTNIPLGRRSAMIYLPNKTSPTQTIGPVMFTVDKGNFLIPTEVFDTATAVAPTPPPGGSATPTPTPTPSPTPTPVPCNSGVISLAGSISLSSNKKTVSFRINNNQSGTIQTIKVSSSNRANLQSMTFSSSSGACTGGYVLSPCPASDNTASSITPDMPYSTGSNLNASLAFSAQMNGEWIIVQFGHSRGCDQFTLTGM